MEYDHAVAVSSGTDALRFALIACGILPGDVVVTVPHTFIATTEAISQAGALPEFVDIDEQTYNMSVEKLREYLEEQCTRNESGVLISRRSNRRVTAVLPGAPLRPDGGHGWDSRTCRRVRPDGDRGCVPGARGGILLAAAESLDEGWFDGARGGVQLLPGQEPGSLWGSRSGCYQRQQSRGQNAGCYATTDRCRSTTTMWKVTTDAWTRFRPACSKPSWHICRSGTSNAVNGQPNTIGCWRTMKRSPARMSPPGHAPCTTSM